MGDNVIKLAFREDKEANLVHCFISSLDDLKRFEIASINLEVVRVDRVIFDRWVQVLQFAFEKILEIEGITVEKFEIFKAFHKN